MKNPAIALLASGFLFAAGQASAGWTSSQFPQLVTGFENQIKSSGLYTIDDSISWQWFSLADCYQPDVHCPFPNPDGPYGQPQFSGDNPAATQLGEQDAFVMIMVTPPQMLYYGVTPYIFTRYYQQIPGMPAGSSGVEEILESLDDSFNMNDLVTSGSTTAGASPYGQLSAIVIAADQTTYNQVKQAFANINFYALNLMDLPANLVPLEMGTSPMNDYYSLLMRMAYPTDANAMQAYINNPASYLVFLKLTSNGSRNNLSLPDPTYKIPRDNGTAEPVSLLTARDNLVSQLQKQYSSAYKLTEQTINLTQTQNFICIDNAINCDDDNSDALYTHDDNSWIPTTLQDKLLIVGVNHVSLGWATYFSHSVLDMTHQAGVEAVNQTWLAGSALKMAGITSKSDPRYNSYKQLYAFTMSYDCKGEKVCLTIPQPTSSNPIGVKFGDTVGESFRAYVDPVTNTRPNSDDIIFHRVFELAKK